MIGTTRSYQHSYRQRRSFRKFYFALFFISAFFLWQTGHLGSRRHVEIQDPADHLAPPTEPEPNKRASSPVVDVYGHHVHVRSSNAQSPDSVQQSVQVREEPEKAKSPAPLSNGDPVIRKAPGGTPRFSAEDGDTDDHEIASDSIKDLKGESVEHAAKLSQADDEEDVHLPESEHAVIGGDRQVRLSDNSPSKPQAELSPQERKELVDQILNADHPSKEPEGGIPEEVDESDIDEPETAATTGEEEKHGIIALKEMTPWSERYQFPSWDECESIKDKADALPDLLHFPFEQSVEDVVLEGWEDEWIAKGRYRGPKLKEPKIDFVYNWVNGSQKELVETMLPYELNSTLNDPEGVWIKSHGSNRYREWNELRYSMRSLEKYAGHFTNRIQILVNAFQNSVDGEALPTTYRKQRPQWLREDIEKVQVLSQEEFFGPEERKCLPTFDSLTIENQLYNTKSEVDRFFALSDDMLLGKPHAASDIFSPLFGPTMGFKENAYNTLHPPTEKDAERFGEKPFLIYTSWLLNRRFGARKRRGQVHFGHSLSRSIFKEAITSFPRPALRSAFQRFRGETGFQLYSWFVAFHYTMERHREALLWSYIMLRSDSDDDGYLDWDERKKILRELSEGMSNEAPDSFRQRMFYRVGDYLTQAGLEPPKVNTDTVWTSLDGPWMIKDLDCDAFDTEDCLAPGFSLPTSDATARIPAFSSAAIFDRITRQSPRCGDCLLKLILNRRRSGLGPLLPHETKKPKERETVIKALVKFQYTVVNPDANFFMVTDAEQAEHVLLKPYIKQGKKSGQMCLNDDVVTQDKKELEQLQKVMSALFEGLFPKPSRYEQ
ncbi:hypothetical protein BCR34DRAFT_607507 [Clohesyomyces aquaticus]|uniref:Stealth protein CR1 conserved region 1 domain-containing protein n=1 Tax=Clohesyomyces aquaticus TaxID=1231657 RepID=A0A1Y1YFU6_9PLEO|nr:hypothetical protein BCR34DRAFT_607507 [Clohesyomyces aquaticus]